MTDSHLELPTVDAPVLPPFTAAAAAGVRAVMTGHIRVPALTGDDPATFSPRAVELLRRECGFGGVAVTDALEMSAAVLAAGGVPRAAVRALAAGADLLCLGSRVDEGLVEAVVAEITAAVGDGRITAGRLASAVARTGKLTTPHPDVALGIAAARRAVRVEGSFAGLASPLVVQLITARTGAEGRTPWGLAPLPDGIERVEVVAAGTTAAELIARAGGRPIVLVARRLHSLPGGPALAEALAAAHPVGVVEMGWPSSWRPAGVRAFLTTHGASAANARAAAEVVF